jgi:hypothetical protein
MPDIIPAWAQTIISAHLFSDAVVVSHATRMKSYRYFVWQEDDSNDLSADNVHAEKAVTGYTDLFTKIEFDPWAASLEASFDAYGIAWEKTGVTYEPDTGFFHHTWDWQVVA